MQQLDQVLHTIAHLVTHLTVSFNGRNTEYIYRVLC